MPTLFTRRRRYIGAHRIVEAALPFLRELAELLDAVALLTDDDRWLDACERFRKAHAALHELAAAQQQLRARAREVAHVDQVLADLHRLPEVVERVRASIPMRRPMARVLAAKIVRRVRSAK